jgi:predicted Fe-S protein YdhL (DUF1289 family)
VAALHITDIESAINWWRERVPTTEGMALTPELSALAEVYGLMVWRRQTELDEDALPGPAMQAWLRWYETTLDAPCIAICSTSQGDEMCKGCGRTFDEVQNWCVMTPVEKRVTWRRISIEATAWRFNRYSERAHEQKK